MPESTGPEGTSSSPEENELSEKIVAYGEHHPETLAMLRWILDLTADDWQVVAVDDLTEAELDVFIKLVCLGLVVKRCKDRVTASGSDIELSVAYDCCGYDDLSGFYKRDVLPAVPEWNHENVGLPLHEPASTFRARLTGEGQSLAARINLLSNDEVSLEGGVDEITKELNELSELLIHSLAAIAKVSEPRFAKLRSLERVRTQAVPEWNPDTNELHYRGNLVCKFGEQARNCRRVLVEFQDLDWPARLDDPLANSSPTKVHDTVQSLNKKQNAILFRSGDGGKCFTWKEVKGD